jgi:hypothetical protein
MFDGLFDKPWLILVIVILFVVMFGSRKLPGAFPRPVDAHLEEGNVRSPRGRA